jgi:predicted HicB family RNase H-like nuclease
VIQIVSMLVAMKQKSNSDQIIVRMPSEVRDEIERKAEAEGRSLGNMTRRILERALSSEPEAA